MRGASRGAHFASAQRMYYNSGRWAARPPRHFRGRNVEIRVVRGDITQQQVGAIVVNLFEGVTAPGGATGWT